MKLEKFIAAPRKSHPVKNEKEVKEIEFKKSCVNDVDENEPIEVDIVGRLELIEIGPENVEESLPIRTKCGDSEEQEVVEPVISEDHGGGADGGEPCCVWTLPGRGECRDCLGYPGARGG